MTRDEALKRAREINIPEKQIDFYIALGMLKLEGRRTVEQEAEDWLCEQGWTRNILEDIRRGGFRIVRETLTAAGNIHKRGGEA